MDEIKTIQMKNQVKELEEIISKGRGDDIYNYVIVLDILRDDYEKLKYDKTKIVSISVAIRDIIEKEDIMSNMSGKEQADIELCLRNAYDTLARHGDFESFMIAMEWNRDIRKQFYLPRRRVLRKHGFIQGIQDLLDRKIKMLVIEAPPGIGKSVMGEFAFVYQYVMNPLTKSLMGGCTNMLVTGFYQDCLDLMTSDEYRLKEIFPDFPEIINNAEYKMIYTERKKREPNLMFVSIEVGATGIIHVDGMLYVDDLIKNAEQANNPDQCQKVRYAYTGTLQDRLVNADVPILVIGTMWSINDHISYLKTKYGGESWFRNISVPCMNQERTESNFMYDFGLEKTVEHWERLIRDDDEIIAQAKFFCVAMDREGKLFNTKEFNYFSTLPAIEPDRVVAFVDVAYGGGDNYSMPIGYVYGRDVYIPDVIYSKEKVDYTRPQTVAKIKQHNIQRVHFEGNNGGELVADNISEDLKSEGVHCNITRKRAPNTKSKLDRILAVASQIEGRDENQGTYRLFFLTKEKQSMEYRKFMSCISRFSQSLDIQGKQEDDAPDSLAGLITNVLGKTPYAKVTSTMSRYEIGF